jgi:chitodextrinase
VRSTHTGVGVFLLFGALVVGSGLCTVPPLEPSYEIGLKEYVLEIKQRVAETSRVLREHGVLPAASGGGITYGPPLYAPHLTDSGYRTVLYFVDHDSLPNAILDWNCGTRTYDGHAGTDYFLWPFGWYKMDSGLIKVVAAAPGVIVDKQDGQFDRCCDGNCGEGNYIVLEHADASRTLYFHLKNGSLTGKAVGQAVLKGENLALVGSSGVSGGPHLHFEVWDSTGAVLDPYGGPCNTSTGESHWDSPQPYYRTSILALVAHDGYPDYEPCPAAVSPHITDLYHPGSPIVFASYQRDLIPGDTTYHTVRRPDSTVQWSWAWPAPETYQNTGGCLTGTYWLPPDAPLGRWTFEAVLRDCTYVRCLYVEPGTGVTDTRIYMESETAQIDGGTPGASCSNSEERVFGHLDGAGGIDYQQAAIFSADMTGIPEGSVVDSVSAHIWAKSVADTIGGRFTVYVSTGDNNSPDCSSCMDWTEAYTGCGIAGTGSAQVFADSSAAPGDYVNTDLDTLFTDRSSIVDKAVLAHANYGQYNHYLYFSFVMLPPAGATNAQADGRMHGEAALAIYRPYVDVHYYPPESHAPVPSPGAWTAWPFPPIGSTVSLAMSGFPASDATPPVEYYFELANSGPGGSDRSWDTARVYTDTGLSPNTEYSYRVKARDSAVPRNEGVFSEPASAYTRAARPPAPMPGDITYNSIQLDLASGLNPAYTEMALWNETDGYWVASDGGNGGSAPTWATDAAWGTVTVTGLTYLTAYCFGAVARNGDGIESTMSPLTCVSTADCASVDTTGGREGERLEFSVSAATPNPAASAIQIRFTLPESQRVRVRVFDVAGRITDRLLDRHLPAGRHEIAWRATRPDGERVEPGLYFLRLEAASGEVTRKVIVLN